MEMDNSHLGYLAKNTPSLLQELGEINLNWFDDLSEDSNKEDHVGDVEKSKDEEVCAKGPQGAQEDSYSTTHSLPTSTLKIAQTGDDNRKEPPVPNEADTNSPTMLNVVEPSLRKSKVPDTDITPNCIQKSQCSAAISCGSQIKSSSNTDNTPQQQMSTPIFSPWQGRQQDRKTSISFDQSEDLNQILERALESVSPSGTQTSHCNQQSITDSEALSQDKSQGIRVNSEQGQECRGAGNCLSKLTLKTPSLLRTASCKGKEVQRMLGVNPNESGLSWTSSLATPTSRSFMAADTNKKDPMAGEDKQLILGAARKLFSPGTSVGDMEEVALDTTAEEDIDMCDSDANLHQPTVYNSHIEPTGPYTVTMSVAPIVPSLTGAKESTTEIVSQDFTPKLNKKTSILGALSPISTDILSDLLDTPPCRSTLRKPPPKKRGRFKRHSMPGAIERKLCEEATEGMSPEMNEEPTSPDRTQPNSSIGCVPVMSNSDLKVSTPITARKKKMEICSVVPQLPSNNDEIGVNESKVILPNMGIQDQHGIDDLLFTQMSQGALTAIYDEMDKAEKTSSGLASPKRISISRDDVMCVALEKDCENEECEKKENNNLTLKTQGKISDPATEMPPLTTQVASSKTGGLGNTSTQRKQSTYLLNRVMEIPKEKHDIYKEDGVPEREPNSKLVKKDSMATGRRLVTEPMSLTRKMNKFFYPTTYQISSVCPQKVFGFRLSTDQVNSKLHDEQQRSEPQVCIDTVNVTTGETSTRTVNTPAQPSTAQTKATCRRNRNLNFTPLSEYNKQEGHVHTPEKRQQLDKQMLIAKMPEEFKMLPDGITHTHGCIVSIDNVGESAGTAHSATQENSDSRAHTAHVLENDPDSLDFSKQQTGKVFYKENESPFKIRTSENINPGKTLKQGMSYVDINEETIKGRKWSFSDHLTTVPQLLKRSASHQAAKEDWPQTGFYTAGGNNIKVNMKDAAKFATWFEEDCSTQRKMTDIADKVPTAGFQTAGGKKLPIDMQVAAKFDSCFEEEHIQKDERSTHKPLKEDKTMKLPTTGFQTAGGKEITVNMQNAAKFAAWFEEDHSKQDKIKEDIVKVPTIGSQASGGKDISLTMNEITKGPITGFQTAGGKDIAINMKDAAKFATWFEDDAKQIHVKEEGNTVPTTGFQTAAGKDISVNMKDTSKFVAWFEGDNTKQCKLKENSVKGPIIGFQTAGGKDIVVDMKDTVKFAAWFEEDDPKQDRGKEEMIKTPKTGFQTAGGKSISVNMKDAAIFASWFAENSLEEEKTRDISTASFKTARGKAMSVNMNDAARFASWFEEDTKQDKPDKTSPLTCGFQTAHGKSIKFDKKQSAKFGAWFEEEKSWPECENVPHRVNSSTLQKGQYKAARAGHEHGENKDSIAQSLKLQEKDYSKFPKGYRPFKKPRLVSKQRVEVVEAKQVDNVDQSIKPSIEVQINKEMHSKSSGSESKTNIQEKTESNVGSLDDSFDDLPYTQITEMTECASVFLANEGEMSFSQFPSQLEGRPGASSGTADKKQVCTEEGRPSYDSVTVAQTTPKDQPVEETLPKYRPMAEHQECSSKISIEGEVPKSVFGLQALTGRKMSISKNLLDQVRDRGKLSPSKSTVGASHNQELQAVPSCYHGDKHLGKAYQAPTPADSTILSASKAADIETTDVLICKVSCLSNDQCEDIKKGTIVSLYSPAVASLSQGQDAVVPFGQNSPTENQSCGASKPAAQPDSPSLPAFTTASGQSVKISDKCLEKATALLRDGNLTSPRRKNEVPTLQLEHSRKSTTVAGCRKLSSNGKAEAMKLGLSTAKGKMDAISDNSLFQVRGHFTDMDNSERLHNPNLNAEIQEEQFLGFHTIGGSAVEISASPLLKAKQIFDSSEKDNFMSVEQQTASSLKNEMQDRAILETVSDTSKIRLLAHTDKNHDSSPEGQHRTKFCGFQTARGKRVTVSEVALKKVKTELIELEDITVANCLKEKDPLTDGKAFPGFKTGHGDKVKISNDAMKKVKNLFDNDAQCKSGFPGFETAGGSKIQVSDVALKKVKTFFYEDNGEDCKEPVSSSKLSFPWFETASDGKVSVSENALTHAKTVLDSKSSSGGPQSKSFPGFETAGGSKVNISQNALEKVKGILCQVDRNDPDLGSISHHAPASPKLETANWEEVNVSENNLKHTKNALDSETTPNSTVEKFPIAGSEIVSGSKFSISDITLKQVKQRRDEGDKTASLGTGTTKTLKMSFETAKGSMVTVTEEALKTVWMQQSSFGSTAQGPTTENHSINLKHAITDQKRNYKQTLNPALENEAILKELQESSKAFLEDGPSDISDEEQFFTSERFNTHNPGCDNKHSTAKDDAGPGSNLVVPSLSAVSSAPEEFFSDRCSLVQTCSHQPLVSAPEEEVRHLNGRENKEVNFRWNGPTSYKTCLGVPRNPESNKSNQSVGRTPSKSTPCITPHSTFSTPYRKQGLIQTQNVKDNTTKVSAKETSAGSADQAVSSFRTPIKTSAMRKRSASDSEPSVISEKKQKVESNVSESVEMDVDLADSWDDDDQDSLNTALVLAELEKLEASATSVVEPLGLAKTTVSDEVAKARMKAKVEQAQRIKKKKETGGVRPMSGNWYRERCHQSGMTLKGTVGSGTPQTHSRKQLHAFGVRESTVKVNAGNAEDHRFWACDFYGEKVTRESIEVRVGDGARLVLDENSTMGKDEFCNAVLDMEGVDPTLICRKWVYNHFRWIVWKLAALEVGFPQVFGGRKLTPDQVMLQLKYRYDREVDHSQRSAVKKIVERDDTPAKALILCVSGVIKLPGHVGASPSKHVAPTDGDRDKGLPRDVAVLELTDGWYPIKAVVDTALTRIISAGKLQVGTKICVYGAELIGSQEAAPPLQAPADTMLKVTANSCRRARWDTQLGFYRNPQPPALPLCSLYRDGGQVCCVDVVVVRVYPLQYMERVADCSSVFRNERAEQKVARKHEDDQQKLMEKVYSKLQEEFEKRAAAPSGPRRSRHSGRHYTVAQVAELTGGQEIDDATQAASDPRSVEDLLTPQQMNMLMEHRRTCQEQLHREMEAEFKAQVDELNEKNPKRNVCPLLKVRLAGCSTQDIDSRACSILTVWRPSDDVREMLIEGKRFKIYNIGASDSRSRLSSGPVALSALRSTRYQTVPIDDNFLDVIYVPREVVSFSELGSSFQPKYEEIDAVGIVIHATPMMAFDRASGDEGRLQTIYVADDERQLAAVTVWGGLEAFGLEELLKPATVVAFANLQWRPNHRNQTAQIPSLTLTETTFVSTNPKEAHLRTALDNLKFSIKVLRTFVEEMTDQLHGRISTLRILDTTPQSGAQQTISRRPVTTPTFQQQPKRRYVQYPGTGTSTPQVLLSTKTSDLCKSNTPQSCQGVYEHASMGSDRTLGNELCKDGEEEPAVAKKRALQRTKANKLAMYADNTPITPLNSAISTSVRKAFKVPTSVGKSASPSLPQSLTSHKSIRAEEKLGDKTTDSVPGRKLTFEDDTDPNIKCKDMCSDKSVSAIDAQTDSLADTNSSNKQYQDNEMSDNQISDDKSSHSGLHNNMSHLSTTVCSQLKGEQAQTCAKLPVLGRSGNVGLCKKRPAFLGPSKRLAKK